MTDGSARSDERPPRGTWRPLVPIYVCVALFAVGEQALHVLVSPYLAERLGQGTAVIGVVLAVFGGASLLSRVPVGAVYRFDRALPMLVVGGLLCTLAFAFVPLVDHPVPFAGLMALDGLGWAIVTTTQLALLVATRPAGLPTAGAMAWYSGSQGIGNTVGGVTAGFLADTFGYAPAFLSLAAIPLIATLVMVRAFRRQSRAGLVNAPQADGLSQRGHVGILRAIRGMPAIVWAGVVIMIYINFMSGLLNTIHPVFALAAGLTLTQIGTLASCRSIASSVVRFASGPIFSRTDRRVSLTFPLAVLSASAVVLLPSVPSSFLLQIPLFLMVGLSRGLLRITGSADAFDGVADDERAHGMTAAVLHGGLDLGKIVGPVLGGGVASVIGLSATFRVLPVALLTIYVVLVTAARRREAGGLAADEPQPQG